MDWRRSRSRSRTTPGALARWRRRPTLRLPRPRCCRTIPAVRRHARVRPARRPPSCTDSATAFEHRAGAAACRLTTCDAARPDPARPAPRSSSNAQFDREAGVRMCPPTATTTPARCDCPRGYPRVIRRWRTACPPRLRRSTGSNGCRCGMNDSKRPPRNTPWLTMVCCQATGTPSASTPPRTRDMTNGR